MNRNAILDLCRTNPSAVADLVLQLQATVAAQQEQIVTLTARVAALEAQLKTDSHNSSKPPSSDPPAHKPHSLRKPSGRKPGGQAGHSGRTLTLSDTPDVVVTHTPDVVVTHTPDVVVTHTPDVVVTHTPDVVVTHTPDVVVTHTPDVVVTHTPDVVVTHTPDVVVTHTPDVVVTHTPAHCADCHADLRATPASGVERRQVLDVPPLTLIVTEHQSERKVCPACGHVTQVAFPAAVTQSVQYGPQVQALGVYLLTYQLLPLKRTSELLGDVFGTTFCAATLVAAQQRAAATLQPASEQIAHAVAQAQVAHFDESGLRVGGKLHWRHVAGTSDFTHYGVQAKRGQTGMNQAGILPHFVGTAVQDGWASYFGYGCRHALCNAHHLRELTAIYEAAPQEQAWAQGMQTLLRDGKHAVAAAQQPGAACLSEATLSALTARYTALVQQGYAANPPPAPQPHTKGRLKQSKARNLLDRLHTYQAETLRFLHDFAVPFDNNLAERDVRMLKVQQKISGGFRTPSGSEAFCCVRSYLSTLRKQGRHLLTALQHVFAGQVPSPLPE